MNTMDITSMAPASGDVAVLAGTDVPMVDQLAADLERFGYAVQSVPFSTSSDELRTADLVAIVTVREEPRSVAFAEAVRRANSLATVPVIWFAQELDRCNLRRRVDLFDDFLEIPYSAGALWARLSLVRARIGHAGFDVLHHGSLELNLSTFQATIDGRPLELTYMEHQLLRFLASSPSRVHTRQAILQSVWGYDYYGGMRTVDVHVRRLRAKLGQENAALIETVRGVGYRFVTEL